MRPVKVASKSLYETSAVSLFTRLPTPALLKVKHNLYLPSAVFIAQALAGPRKQLKQIIQTEYNIVKIPNWPEAKQLVIYKCGGGFELEATEKQIQVMVRAGLEPGTAG